MNYAFTHTTTRRPPCIKFEPVHGNLHDTKYSNIMVVFKVDDAFVLAGKDLCTDTFKRIFAGWHLQWRGFVQEEYMNNEYFLFKTLHSDAWALTSASYGTCEHCCEWEKAFISNDPHDYLDVFKSMEYAAKDSTFASGSEMLGYLRREYPNVVRKVNVDVLEKMQMSASSRVSTCPRTLIHKTRQGEDCLRLPYVYAYVHGIPLDVALACAHDLGQIIPARVPPITNRKVDVLIGTESEQGRWVKINHYAPRQFPELMDVMKQLTLHCHRRP